MEERAILMAGADGSMKKHPEPRWRYCVVGCEVNLRNLTLKTTYLSNNIFHLRDKTKEVLASHNSLIFRREVKVCEAWLHQNASYPNEHIKSLENYL